MVGGLLEHLVDSMKSLFAERWHPSTKSSLFVPATVVLLLLVLSPVILCVLAFCFARTFAISLFALPSLALLWTPALSSLLLLLLPILFGLYSFHELYWKRRLLPPGPIPWLIAGNMPQVLLHGAHNIDALLQRWRAEYDGIFTFWMGPIPICMVSRVDLLRRFFVTHGDAFSGRWQNFITHTFMDGHNGVVQIQGEKWREQRRFALHVLRDFGLGRALMENKIRDEVRSLIAHLNALIPNGACRSAPLDVCKPVAVCIANIIDNILFGRTYAHDDPAFIRVQQLLDRQSALVVRPVMGLYLCAPFATRLPWLRSAWRELLAIRDEFWAFLDGHIEEHRQHFRPNMTPTDFTFAYMLEMKRRSANGEEYLGHFSEKQLKMLLLDLFFAGSETTVTTTKWGILFLLLHPEVQQRCYAELLEQLGEHGETELRHRPRLVYLNATVAEIQRLANILPINLLRTCTESVRLDGFQFPPDTMVLPQISITLSDPNHFPEPDRFRPERFIDPRNGTLRRIDAFLPFSIGKRQCLGESLARAELFLIFAELIRHFEFRAEKPPSRQRIYGLTVSPQPFKCQIIRRKMP
uniref:Cytochrome P450 n=1 Tax=Globodera rostochiensis TaxID=31243 RepID=A0A914HBU1_GLORO